MNRRSFITTALAGLGAVALLKESATASEPDTLTVKQWAEKHRIESWEPIAVSYVPLPIFPSILEAKIAVDDHFGRANVYMRFNESEPWTYLGPVERVTVEVKPPPPRLADRPARFIVQPDEADLIERFARVRYRSK